MGGVLDSKLRLVLIKTWPDQCVAFSGKTL